MRQNNTNALITWRSLATDEEELGFNLYRTTDGKTVKVNDKTLTGGTNFVDTKADFSKANTYFVKKHTATALQMLKPSRLSMVARVH